jgi:hypothetical protein
MKPTAEEKAILDRITVRKYRQVTTANGGQSYFGEIWVDGKLVTTGSNEGRGGCDDFHPVDAAASALWEKLGQEWAKATGDDFEPEDALFLVASVRVLEAKRGVKGAR